MNSRSSSPAQWLPVPLPEALQYTCVVNVLPQVCFWPAKVLAQPASVPGTMRQFMYQVASGATFVLQAAKLPVGLKLIVPIGAMTTPQG